MARSEEVAAAVSSGQIFASLPFLLEAGYSARNASEHAQVTKELSALPYAALTSEVEDRAASAQRQLARSGHHRMPPVDILMASLADHHKLGILHYDRDYDLLTTWTDLRFSSVWLARRGSL